MKHSFQILIFFGSIFTALALPIPRPALDARTNSDTGLQITRQEGVAEVVELGIDIVEAIVDAVNEKNKDDRNQWTQDMVMGFFNASPHKNWVIANTANRPQVTNGVNCEEQDRTFQGGPAGDTQYHVWGCVTGIFEMWGDGGFLNYAYVPGDSQKDSNMDEEYTKVTFAELAGGRLVPVDFNL